MRPFSTATTVIIAAIYLLGMAGNCNAWVLCVGEGGHVAVELGVNGDCCPEESRHEAHAAREACFHEQQCGACVDIAIGFEGISRSPKRELFKISEAAPSSADADPTGDDSFGSDQQSPLPSPAGGDSSFQFLQTVRLLI